VTLGTDIAAVLPELRAQAESRMTDTCRITRPGDGEPVMNPDTGQYEDPSPVEVYGPATAPYFGKCRIPVTNGSSSFTRNGGADQSFGVGEYPLDVPALTDGIEAGQTVTYLTAPDNPALVGMVFGLTEPLLASQSTKQRWKMKATVAQ
jgi:hypothetical protein